MRRSRDLTQKQLGELIGVSGSAISMYERCERVPDFEVLEALADVFNVPMSAFLDEDSKEVNERLQRELEEAASGSNRVVSRSTLQSLSDADITAIAKYIIERDDDEYIPREPEIKILSRNMDRLSKEQRDMAVNVFNTLFAKYIDEFDKEGTDDDAKA